MSVSTGAAIFQRNIFQNNIFQVGQTASFLFGGGGEPRRKRKPRVEEHPDVKTHRLANFASGRMVRNEGDDDFMITMLLAL